ncbi:MAG TPA: exo-alpha-sialidase [Nocardioidaceae bacterium]|nr:exo-alpha-sialidase [Nocardioidaceae bacterium]
MARDVILMIGTRKGLWLARSDESRDSWAVEGPEFLMNEVASCAIDTRGAMPRLLAGVVDFHFGPQVFRSDDLGKTWERTADGAIRFPEDTGAALERVWQLAPAGDNEPDVVYAGTQPSALFRSSDRGETFSLVRPLWDHPHREQWGAGFGGQAIHTILPGSDDSARMTVAMSTGGVYQTADAGESWRPANVGVKAYFMPDPWPEFGQCVHKVAGHPAAPDRMYLQNHHGVYRSDDRGANWVSIAAGLPSDFGFPIVVDPHDPDTVYLFPLVADGERIPPGGRPRVWRSRDRGESWTELSKGLPGDGFYSAVVRDAMCADGADPTGVYFGSREGSVYASNDAGDSWRPVANHLPDVLSVRAAQLG